MTDSILHPTRRKTCLRPYSYTRSVLCLLLFFAVAGAVPAKDRSEYARELKSQLVQKIMPYWYDTAIDQRNGGYILADDAAR